MVTVVNAQVLHQRNWVTLVLVACFVIVIVIVSITVYFLRHREDQEFDEGRLNVLFIVVDDLRPTLGCYGDKRAITPNIDQLAQKSVLFTQAAAQQALCAPSRTSFLTSRRPDTLHLYATSFYWRHAIWNFTTMPEHFKDNGYETVSVGKVFHPGIVSGHEDDYPYSWSSKPYHPPTQEYKMDPVCPSADGKEYMNLICPIVVAEQKGQSLPDLEITEYTLNFLKNRTKTGPFFLAVGFNKPHIPFKIPREYFDLYPIDTLDLAPYPTKPDGLPDVSWNPWSDLRLRHDVQQQNAPFPFGPLPDNFQKLIRQAYYASTSYMDDQVGKVLEALEKNGYASNTAIVLIGDHGWSLGEHGEWSKYSNFEVATRVPLIVYVPDLTEPHDDHVKFEHIPVNISKEQAKDGNAKAKYVADEFVELVDLFPTLAEVANIAIPTLCTVKSSNVTSFCSEGVSFYNVLQNYAYPASDFSWKTAVFSQYPRPSDVPQNDSDQPRLENITLMGYSIRNDLYRYTRWVEFDKSRFEPKWAVMYGHELYDKNSDPHEKNNLVNDPNHSKTVIGMFEKLKNGWRHALPYEIFGSRGYKHRTALKTPKIL